MQEAHHRVPQPAVSQTLLVPDTRTLQIITQRQNQSFLSTRFLLALVVAQCVVLWYLYILS